ncbi:MAG: YggS family pyridoxal phosphate-dependent enzyme [Candidatus Cloacimonetes bacterium]|nr:YggS family pyridoxal phosphate-dependent enzyme [Candidatus Cloacimonadota bacterium]
MLELQIQRIRNEIYECAVACNRKIDEIKILAVTKTHPINIINEALESGIDYIAESRVQEAEEKIPKLRGLYEEFHFVGNLQTNKVQRLLALKPTLIHSVDRMTTAKTISNFSTKLQRTQDILIEVNTSGEESKIGVHPSECAELIKRVDELPFVRVLGLMTIGPLVEDDEVIRKSFSLLRELFEKEKRRKFKQTQMKYLSMGMSSDFKIAIQEGANILRLGSILFGERNTKK